jgi:hypothetical protein
MIARTMNGLDTAFALLADPARRRLLVTLWEHDDGSGTKPIPLDRLLGDREHRTMRVRMYHVHLPKLADERIVEWDRESNTVATGPRFDVVRPLLELLENNPNAVPNEWL